MYIFYYMYCSRSESRIVWTFVDIWYIYMYNIYNTYICCELRNLHEIQSNVCMYVCILYTYKPFNETSLSYTNFVGTNGDIIKCVPSIREVMKWACILQHVNISDWILCAAMATLRQVLNYVLLLYKYTNIYLYVWYIYVLMQSSTDEKYNMTFFAISLNSSDISVYASIWRPSSDMYNTIDWRWLTLFS